MMMGTYLDYAATTPVCDAAAHAALEAMQQHFGNPSSLYRLGLDAENLIAASRRRLAKALDCTMEDIMELSPAYESDTGLPTDKSYLECGLPDFLMESIAQMQAAWDRLDRGEKDLCWDCDYCNLQTDINNAEVNQVISSEQAWYLREKYLRMERW